MQTPSIVTHTRDNLFNVGVVQSHFAIEPYIKRTRSDLDTKQNEGFILFFFLSFDTFLKQLKHMFSCRFTYYDRE
jgi:hypothetical protein